ncbi:MAG: hypothetical protein ACU0CI_06400 [Shimia sp.]
MDALDPLTEVGRIAMPEGIWRLNETDLRDPPARLWVSATPIFGKKNAFNRNKRPGAPLRPKASQTLERQAWHELLRLPGLPSVAEVAVIEEAHLGWKVWTGTGSARNVPANPVYGRVAVLFEHPHAEPFAIGALSHWGLGAFRPARADQGPEAALGSGLS